MRPYLNLWYLTNKVKVSFKVWPGTESVLCHYVDKRFSDFTTWRLKVTIFQEDITMSSTTEWQDKQHVKSAYSVSRQPLDYPRQFERPFLTGKHVLDKWLCFHSLCMMSHISKATIASPVTNVCSWCVLFRGRKQCGGFETIQGNRLRLAAGII